LTAPMAAYWQKAIRCSPALPLPALMKIFTAPMPSSTERRSSSAVLWSWRQWQCATPGLPIPCATWSMAPACPRRRSAQTPGAGSRSAS